MVDCLGRYSVVNLVHSMDFEMVTRLVGETVVEMDAVMENSMVWKMV